MELNEGESELVLDALADYERTCAAADSVASSGYTQWVSQLRERLLAAHREQYRDDHAPTFAEVLAKAEADGRAAGRTVARTHLLAAVTAHGLVQGVADVHAELRKREQDEDPHDPTPRPGETRCRFCGLAIMPTDQATRDEVAADMEWAGVPETLWTLPDGTWGCAERKRALIPVHLPERPGEKAARAFDAMAAALAGDEPEPEEDPGRTCASESAEGTRCELSMLPGAHGSGRAGEPCHRGFNRGGVEVTWAAGNRQHERPLRPGDVICRSCGKRLRPRGLLGGPFVSREPGGVSELCGGTDVLHVPVRPEEWETTLPTAPTDDELPEAADAVPANLAAVLDGAPLRDVVRRLSVVRAAPSWTDGWSVAVRVDLHGLVPSDDEEQAVVLTMRATKGYLDARLEAELPKATPRWARTQPEAWGAEVARETGRRLRGDLPAREALLALEAAGHKLQRERDRAAAELDRSQG